MGISDKIQGLMNERGITAYKLSKDTGVSYTGLTKILNGQTANPQVSSIKAIADYFDKPLTYFVSFDVQDTPEWANKKDVQDFKKMLEEDSNLMFDGVPLDAEDKQRVLGILQALFWDAKKTNKEKFTSNRHKENTGDNE